MLMPFGQLRRKTTWNFFKIMLIVVLLVDFSKQNFLHIG